MRFQGFLQPLNIEDAGCADEIVYPAGYGLKTRKRKENKDEKIKNFKYTSVCEHGGCMHDRDQYCRKRGGKPF